MIQKKKCENCRYCTKVYAGLVCSNVRSSMQKVKTTDWCGKWEEEKHERIQTRVQ